MQPCHALHWWVGRGDMCAVKSLPRPILMTFPDISPSRLPTICGLCYTMALHCRSCPISVTFQRVANSSSNQGSKDHRACLCLTLRLDSAAELGQSHCPPTKTLTNKFSDLFLNFTLLEQIWCVTVCQKQADGQSAELAVRDNGSTGK